MNNHECEDCYRADCVCDEDKYTCPMCGSSMTVRPVFDGTVIDCDNDNQDCNFQEDYQEIDDE